LHQNTQHTNTNGVRDTLIHTPTENVAETAIRKMTNKKTKWNYIDVDQAALNAGVPHIDIIVKLNNLNDSRIIFMSISVLNHVYRIEKALPDGEQRHEIPDTLFDRI
jgi:hypothetical protein